MTEGAFTAIVGAGAAAFGALLTFVVNLRRVKVDELEVLRRTMNDLSNTLNREVGRLDEVCRRQQDELEAQNRLINGLENRVRDERQAKHDCNERLQATTIKFELAKGYASRLQEMLSSRNIPVPLPPYEVNNA